MRKTTIAIITCAAALATQACSMPTEQDGGVSTTREALTSTSSVPTADAEAVGVTNPVPQSQIRSADLETIRTALVSERARLNIKDSSTRTALTCGASGGVVGCSHMGVYCSISVWGIGCCAAAEGALDCKR